MDEKLRNFITASHQLFDEIGYRIYTEHEWDDIEAVQSAINTINRCSTFEEALEACKLAKLLVKNIDEIHECIIEYPELWESLEYKGKSTFHLLENNEATSIYVTDAIFSDQKLVLLTSSQFSGNYIVKLENGAFRYSFEDMESPLILKPDLDQPNRCEILDKLGRHYTDVVMNDTNNLFLENNSTNLDVLISGEMLGIFDKEKVDDLLEGQNLGDEDCLATIDWDVIDSKEPYSISKVDILGELNGPQKLLVYLIALGAFVIYHRLKANNSLD